MAEQAGEGFPVGEGGNGSGGEMMASGPERVRAKRVGILWPALLFSWFAFLAPVFVFVELRPSHHVSRRLQR